MIAARCKSRAAPADSLTLDRPLHPQTLANGFISLNGTPTDRVHLGVNGLLLPQVPDMVVSGINLGANLGDDVLYPARGRRCVGRPLPGHHIAGVFAVVASARQPADGGLHRLSPGRGTVASGAAATHCPQRQYPQPAAGAHPWHPAHPPQVTGRGRRAPNQGGQPARQGRLCWIAVAGVAEDGGPGTDFHAVRCKASVSITPLRLDRTFNDAFEQLDGWLEGVL